MVLARYFDGTSSRAQSVALEIRDECLIAADDLGIEIGRWPLESLRDENTPPSPDRLNLSVVAKSAQRLIIEENEMIEALLGQCQNLRKKRARAAGWWRSYVVGSAAAITSVGLFFIFGLPLLASGIANMIPLETRSKIGSSVEQHMIRVFAKDKEGESICTSASAQAALEKLVAQFNQVGNSEIPQISVTVVNSKAANAFALPGGRMVILSGLLDKAEDPNALAGIIAHEFGHMEGKHPTSLFVTNIGIAAILSLAFGDVSGGTIIAGVGQMALGAAYSRDYERFADTRAIELMHHWNYNIAPSISLLQNLVGEQKNTPNIFSLFSSHPEIQERIDQLKSAGDTGTLSAFSETDWQAIKVMCSKSI